MIFLLSKKKVCLLFLSLFLVFYSQIFSLSIPHQIMEDIHEKSLNKSENFPIIAIAGCPGVGKTTFAMDLAENLSRKGVRSIIISFDHFGKIGEERKGLRNELDIERIRWKELHRVLQDIKHGKKYIKKPIINQLTKERDEEILDLENVDVIFFEGMYTIAKEPPMKLLAYVDLGIYLESTTENICKWKWERENKKTHPRTFSEFEIHMTLIFEDFIKFVYPTKQNADWVLFVDDHHELTVISSSKNLKGYK